MKTATKIILCNCDRGDAAIYQDRVYGKNKRLHNPNKDGFRCTVCGNQKKNVITTK